MLAVYWLAGHSRLVYGCSSPDGWTVDKDVCRVPLLVLVSRQSIVIAVHQAVVSWLRVAARPSTSSHIAIVAATRVHSAKYIRSN